MSGKLSSEDYASLEQAAYEAAIIPDFWPKVLARLGEISDSAGAGVVVLNERGVNIVCAPKLDSARKALIEGRYLERSGRAKGVVERGLVGVPRFLNEHDYYTSLHDADRDPVVTDVFRKEGMGWAAGWLLKLPHDDVLIMNVEQYFERGPIVGDALARLDSVYSIFARSLTLAARAGFERVRTAVETLAAVGLPAAAVTPKSRVTFANEAFAKATHVWTTRGRDRLALHDQVADVMLGDALTYLHVAEGHRSIPIRAELGGPVVAVVQVIPVRRAAHDIFGGSDAIVILSEPTAQAPDATLIQSLFDLTPAEIAVAQAIAAGTSVTDIAKAHGRSVVTIRNQLRSAMAKTGSKRQVELALLVRQLTRPGN